MDVSAGCVARCSADVNLIVQFCEELFLGYRGSSCADEFGSACCFDCFLEEFCGCGSFFFGCVDFDEVAAETCCYACGSCD